LTVKINTEQEAKPPAPLGVTWRHRSRDHLIPLMPFPIGGPLEPSLYL